MMLLAPSLRKTVGNEKTELRDYYSSVWMKGGSWEPTGFRIVKSYPAPDLRVKFGLEFIQEETLELRSESSNHLYQVNLSFRKGQPVALDSVQFLRG